MQPPLLFVTLCVSLELEAHGPLDLAFAEERAACSVHGLERGVVNQSRRSRDRRRAVDARRGSGGGVNLRIRTGNLSAIEEVKAFNQELQSSRFIETNTTRNAHVDVPDARKSKAVLRRQGETR